MRTDRSSKNNKTFRVYKRNQNLNLFKLFLQIKKKREIISQHKKNHMGIIHNNPLALNFFSSFNFDS